MPTLAKMRDAIDTFLANKWPTIVARQQNFYANRGRYWQGLKTHIVCPAHTNGQDGSKAADRFDDGPTDQFSTWLNVFPEWVSELLPCCIWIDVYKGPDGEGWVANVEATHEGVMYRRSQNVGPESHRTKPWHVVTPPSFPS